MPEPWNKFALPSLVSSISWLKRCCSLESRKCLQTHLHLVLTGVQTADSRVRGWVMSGFVVHLNGTSVIHRLTRSPVLCWEFQPRFWLPKTPPARASVRGLEFGGGLSETEARRCVAASPPAAPVARPPCAPWETAEVRRNADFSPQ